MTEDLITRMARKAYETTAADANSQGYNVVPWDEALPMIRDSMYDAMWEALHLLKEPTDEMVQAGEDAQQYLEPAEVFPAMINQLLEVKTP